MKILITGSTGQVGYELKRSLNCLGKIQAPARAELDLADKEALLSYLEKFKPDIIVNSAAWTAVDSAEEQEDAARVLNTELPTTLANYCQEHGKLLVHYSTDYVYNNPGEMINSEDSCKNPVSVYGKTKLAGDIAIQSSGAAHLIFRTSWVFSARGNNFVKTMLRLGATREQLQIVADQVGSPTSAKTIAQVTTLAIQKWLTATPSDQHHWLGTYHLVSSGYVSWFEFAKAIFDKAAKQGFSLSVKDVAPITTSEYVTPAQRPLNSRLSIEAIEQTFKLSMPSWQEQLDLTLEELQANCEYRKET